MLTAGPPAHGNVRQLPSAHRATIEPDTVTGTWTGEPLDLAHAVSVYAARSA